MPSQIPFLIFAALLIVTNLSSRSLFAEIAEAQSPAKLHQEAPASEDQSLVVTAGKSLIIDSPTPIVRVSIGNAEIAEALAVTPREVLVNAKARGETTLIIWQKDGKRFAFDLAVRPNTAKVDAINRLLRQVLKDP
jgi:pilus assembly protein CpaC